METFLVRLRRSLLLDYQSSPAMSPGNLSLAAAVAHQCFNNEYIFHESREEQKIVAGLEKDTVHDFSTGNWQDKESLVVILSMYRGLSRLACAKSLCRVSLKHVTPLLHRCLIRFVNEPFREKKLSEEIPSIGITDSKTSHAISRQYEENPYPRWFSLGEKSNSLAQKLEKDFPAYIAPGALGNKRVRILVAGSGSGWQPLALARANSGAEIVAVDLSRSSLAYGMRMAEKFAISNVTFLHGDLLEIMRLGQTFHHIACYGVLHHMEKPDEGWQALDNVLLPGGTFHIGLYSRVARLPVVFIRNEIKKKNLQPTVENMKDFRGLLLKEPRYRQIRDYFISSTDFYNLSTLRDLLFNASEMQYTIPRLQKTIHHFDYIFLGFHLRSPAMQKRYRQQFPADTGYTSMQNWLSFEKAYTGTGNMLDFWLQKRYG
ncbi:MAG: class I SAM-dependent methyltransferase [bacterium]|nr:class I SAM-dependent methyltransferase [bacterium]